MSEVERIADQLNRAIAGEAWHGPAVLELLACVTAQHAAARPPVGAHSIWELSLHIEAWLRACSRRLSGDRAQLIEAEDWPAVADSDEAAWQKTINSIKEAHEELARAILNLDDSRLDDPVLTKMSSVYVTLHGAIQHSLYHAGQIAILKKALSEGQTA
ncbi:MAG TPA: DinB family protein [Pyrinomonadaceae bacterium]|nr:DinB family protein [Pyrinomonadaceae bacterium]